MYAVAAFRLTGMLPRYHYVILLCPKKSEALLVLLLLLLVNHKRGFGEEALECLEG